MHVADHPGTQNRYPFRSSAMPDRVCGLSLSKPTGAPIPTSAVLSLSKGAVLSLSKALRPGMRPSGVQNGRVGGARILVVEDSDAIRLPVVAALAAHGFELAVGAGRNRS